MLLCVFWQLIGSLAPLTFNTDAPSGRMLCEGQETEGSFAFMQLQDEFILILYTAVNGGDGQNMIVEMVFGSPGRTPWWEECMVDLTAKGRKGCCLRSTSYVLSSFLLSPKHLDGSLLVWMDS